MSMLRVSFARKRAGVAVRRLRPAVASSSSLASVTLSYGVLLLRQPQAGRQFSTRSLVLSSRNEAGVPPEGSSTSSSASPSSSSSSSPQENFSPSSESNASSSTIPPPHGHQEALPPPPPQSVLAIIREEFTKLFRYVAHDVSKTAEASAESLKAYKDKMTDANLSEEEKEKRRKKTEAYQKIMQTNAAKAKAEADAKTANMTFFEKMKYTMQQMKQAASPQQGVAALVQHCAAAHQAEVAVEQGIDVEDIQIVLEQVKKADGIGYETKVVGYIDAPKASEEQVYAYAERLKQKCPAANMMQERMEWRKKDSRRSGGDVSPGTLSGRDYTMRDSDFTPSHGVAGPSAAAFPSSFRNRHATSQHHNNSDDFFDEKRPPKSAFGAAGFDNPFEKLKILREAPPFPREGTKAEIDAKSAPSSTSSSGTGTIGTSTGDEPPKTSVTDSASETQTPKP